MGIHKTSATRNMRTRRAHLDRCEDGSIIARYIDFAYCFIGERRGTLTLKGKEMPKHPAFENISGFEGWCMRYYAEHDV